MPRSPRKSTKTTAKTPAKSKNKTTKPNSEPTTPLSDASRILNMHNAPPTTPRVIDFTLALEEGNADGWSSDDSFEEKITWSRHRMRVTPGGFTPRNIQEVRRRLNLANLPEDTSPVPLPTTRTKPLLKKHPANTTPRPSTPIKSFLAKDRSILPPTPSPKKTPAADNLSKKNTILSPVKNRVPTKGSPLKMRTVGGRVSQVRPSSPLRPTSPLRMPVTQVKEFKFASETRTRRRSPEKEKLKAELPNQVQGKSSAGTRSPGKFLAGKRTESKVATVDDATVEDATVEDVTVDYASVDHVTVDHLVAEETTMKDAVEDGDTVEEVGLAARIRAREIGMARILAWGETRGRSLHD